MKKDEAFQEFLRLCDEKAVEIEEICQKAKDQGKYYPGAPYQQQLIDCDAKYREKFRVLIASIAEE